MNKTLFLFVILIIVIAQFACSRQDTDESPQDDVIQITVWFHSGQESERAVINEQVIHFNATQDQIQVKLTVLPEGSYNAQVQAAALAGQLPDLLEFDGPFLYNYVWQGRLRPLDDLLPDALKHDLLPTIIEQGTYGGHLYSVGSFDSGLGLYGRRSKLAAMGIRIPKGPEDAWTSREFGHILAALAEQDPDGAVIDLKFNYHGEWYTYAFSPILQSAGADLIGRPDYKTADQVLNSPAAVIAFKEVQGWFKKGYVDSNVDDAGFVQERVALSWAGHWEYARYSAAFGNDLVILPLPDFGAGTKSGQGSWSWGITADCRHPDAAVKFLMFILQPDEILRMASANGAIPARRSAIAGSDLYSEQGALHIFVTQLLAGYTVPRPRTPAYPVITSAFQQAFADIRDGADVQAVLDQAVAVIDQDIMDNKGYPLQ